MTDWGQGYVTEVGYTHGYYRELVPSVLAFATLVRGLHFREVKDRPLRVLELGCGQGFSANVIAAADPTIDYVAVDFNPTHIAGARALADEANLENVTFLEASFCEVAADPNLGTFDIVTLHGIYTWVSAENREHILRIAREKLKTGGLLFVSYNSYPAWASVVPIRRLLRDTAAERPNEPISKRLDAGFSLFQDLLKLNARSIVASPGLSERITKAQNLDRSYAAHEYLNSDWTIFHFADVAADMARAKLTYASTAYILDLVDDICLSPEQRAFLSTASDPIRREGLRDLIVNQGFRRDIYSRGALPIQGSELAQRWREQRVALTIRATDLPLRISHVLGDADLKPEVYGPIRDALGAGPRTVGELANIPALAAFSLQSVIQAVTILVGSGNAHPALPEAGLPQRITASEAFNTAVLARSRDTGQLNFLASPVLGAGVPVDRISMLMLLAHREGHKDVAGFVWGLLKSQGQSLTRSGTTLVGDEENLSELRRLITVFEEKRLPVLHSLGIFSSSL